MWSDVRYPAEYVVRFQISGPILNSISVFLSGRISNSVGIRLLPKIRLHPYTKDWIREIHYSITMVQDRPDYCKSFRCVLPGQRYRWTPGRLCIRKNQIYKWPVYLMSKKCWPILSLYRMGLEFKTQKDANFRPYTFFLFPFSFPSPPP